MTPDQINFRAEFKYDQGVLIRLKTNKPAYIYYKVKKRDVRPYGLVVSDGRRYAVHRVVWAVVYGEWPQHGLDHVNRDTRDNRIENLRLATPSENSRNKSKATNNTSGHNGIDWNQDKWRVRVGTTFGGRYDSLDLALKVRNLLYSELGYVDDHGD